MACRLLAFVSLKNIFIKIHEKVFFKNSISGCLKFPRLLFCGSLKKSTFVGLGVHGKQILDYFSVVEKWTFVGLLVFEKHSRLFFCGYLKNKYVIIFLRVLEKSTIVKTNPRLFFCGPWKMYHCWSWDPLKNYHCWSWDPWKTNPRLFFCGSLTFLFKKSTITAMRALEKFI